MKKEEARSIANLLYNVSGKRYEMLNYLHEKDELATWTQIMFDLKINPKSLRDNFRILESNNFVEHVQGHGYRLTARGKKTFEALENCRDVIEH